ncbi:thiamine-phosphate kinase [bacterium]|nr:thiamine-phosphate kinase [bacterium]
MKEKEFINTIKKVLRSDYIGDDCAYLKDLGIVVSQDNLVEDVHFSLKYTNAYKLGYKSAMVNISDIAASGAEPKYLTVGLSLPKKIESDFVEDFYNGMKAACNSVEIVGGDITGSEKILISVTVIGKVGTRKISSRSNARIGYKVLVSGEHGSSGAGLKQLQNCDYKGVFVNSHLMPKAQVEFSKYIAENITFDYAMMDTSDGLMDALEQISRRSGVLISVNFDKIPYDKRLKQFENFRDLVLYGGEDYQLVACVPRDFNVPNSHEIGIVKEGIGVEVDGILIDDFENKLFNHFK